MPEINGGAPKYDVVIVGGGMVGASLAIALSGASLNVAVIEAVAMPQSGLQSYQPSYDSRSTAFSWGTRLIYERLGLWKALAENVTPIRHIHVSDKGRFGASRLHAKDYHVDALGYVVPNAWIGAVLHQSLEALKQPLDHWANSGTLHWLCPAQVNEVEQVDGESRLRLESDDSKIPRELTGKLLVIADGGRSGLSQRLGIESDEKPYGQHAVIANLTMEKAHDFWAFERFTARGPMALLPLGAQDTAEATAALVWTVPDDRFSSVCELSDVDFCRAVQQAFGHRLGRILHAGTRAHYPLTLSVAKEQIRPGLVVIGNAAHSLHPVAGQGYNLALRDVMTLAEVIRRAAQAGKNIAAYSSLNEYIERQQKDQDLTIHFSDRVTRLFSNDNQALGALRDLGLIGLDLLPGLKQQFARHAMGIGGQEARW